MAKFYALLKTHKENFMIDLPSRPVISDINTPPSFVSKFLCNILQNCCSLPKSHVKNSFDTKEKLKDITIPEDYILISLDVVSLFSNISKDQVLQSLDKRFNKIHSKSKVPFHLIVYIINFIFDNLYFTYNDKVYRQIMGTPMGSAISPLIADLVMEDVEIEALSKLDYPPIFYLRYVDDILTCIPNNKLSQTVNVFNNINNNIHFTYEIEKNNSINFLDLLLINNNGKIITNWFQKPRFSGRLLNYNSNHPNSQKIGIIYNLIDRAIKLSDKKFHSDNIKLCKNLLLLNNYPINFINKYANKRLHIINQIRNNSDNNNNIDSNNKTDNNNIICINTNIYNRIPKVKIPFVPVLFNNIKNVIKKYKIIPIPGITNKLNKFIIRGKDITYKLENVNTVYKFKCNNCKYCYVGESKRALYIRLEEHEKDVKNNCDKPVPNHCVNNHMFEFNKVSIMDFEPNLFKRKISEMLHIQANFTVNKKEDTMFLNSFYKNFINYITRKFPNYF